MFVPGDPRFDEILKLASQATGSGLRDQDRPRWRELVTQLLGELIDRGHVPERRRQLRAALELEVDILAPDEVASLATSSIGAGGLALRIKEILPLGTLLDLSIKLEQRKVPLFARVQVVYSRPGEVGAAFVDLFQGDRELLEGIAVTALLARAALE
jgi:PilZ domain